jgi:hypothetical protein
MSQAWLRKEMQDYQLNRYKYFNMAYALGKIYYKPSSGSVVKFGG